MSKKLHGNGFWESSRMILPEHRERLLQHTNETDMDRLMAKQQGKRPVRTDFELEELGSRLIEAKAEGTVVRMDVWGRSDPVVGRIVSMDARTRSVHVEGDGGLTRVPFVDVIRVQN